MADEPDDFELGTDYDGKIVMWINGIPMPIDEPYEEAEADPVEVDSRVRGVEWRDVYGDDQLRTSSHYDEAHPQEETPERHPGRGVSLLWISRSLSRLVTRQRRRRI
jgi:hypothetical protein